MDAVRIDEAKPRASVVVPYQNRDSVGRSHNQGSDCRQWTIKGLPSETVEVSREAAKRSGMKLNSWVGMALQKAAETPMPNKEAALEVSKDVELRLIKEELARIRAQGEVLESTVNSISAILIKLYTAHDK